MEKVMDRPHASIHTIALRSYISRSAMEHLHVKAPAIFLFLFKANADLPFSILINADGITYCSIRNTP